MASKITVEELAIKLGIDSKMQKDVSLAKGELLNLEKATEKSTKSMSTSFAKFGAAVYGLKTVFGAISSSLGSAISRVDTMNNYNNIMSNLGISSDHAEASIQMLSKGLEGLPTTLNDAVQSVTRFTSANENVVASTRMFLGLNNAILAGAAPIEQQRSAMEQLSQAYAKGKPDMMEWRAAMSAMPAQMKQVALAMNFKSADQLGEALRKGKVSMNEFMMTVDQLNQKGQNGFQSFEEQARNSTGGIATSIANMRTAIVRGVANVIDAFGRANIAAFFNTITKAINIATTYAVAFTKVMIMAAQSIALAFGGTVKKTEDVKKSINGSVGATGGISNGMDDVGKGLDKANKKAKDLKKTLHTASFDNMNILQSNKDSNSDGGKKSADVGSIAMPPLDFGDFDLSVKEAESKVDKLVKDMMRALNQFNFEPLERSFKFLLKTVEPIVETLTLILGYLWSEIMVPLAKWTISNLLPAFVNLLSGVLKVADPIIKSVALVGKFMFDVFLIPAAKFAGGIFVKTINTFAMVLVGLGKVMSDNQPIVVAGTVAITAMLAAYQVATLVNFIKTSGGVIGAIDKMTGASKIMLAIKNSEIAVQIQLGAILLKEQAIRLVTTAHIGLETAATNGSVVAKFALAAATKVATVATAAFKVALDLLSGPIGWLILGVSAVVAGFALYKKGADEAGVATGEMSQAQLDLQNHFDGTEERLKNQQTEFDKLSDETLPKLKSQYEDVTRTLAQERLEINTEGLDGLAEKTQSVFETAKNAINENTNLMYSGLSDFYANSNILTEEEEKEILDKILVSGKDKEEVIQGHYDAAMAIKNNAATQGRGLTKEEQEEYQFHLDEMNRIAIETITPEQARQVAQLESFNARKGQLNEEERDEYMRLQEERYNTELSKIQTEMGFQLDALEKAKNDKIISEEDYSKQKNELLNEMNAKEYELMDRQSREILEMATGVSADQLNVHNKYKDDYLELQRKKATGYGVILTEEEKMLEKNYQAREKELQDTKKAMKSFNDDWLDKQPSIFKGVYENINKGMSMEDGIKQINRQRGQAEDAGIHVVGGVQKGIEKGESGAINAMSKMAQGIIAKAKKDFDINSPSRVMESLFGWVPKGAALGIDKNADDAVKSMSSMVDQTIDETSRLKDFQYPDFTTEYKVNANAAVTGLNQTATMQIDSIVSGYEQTIKALEAQPIVIENKTTLEVDSNELGEANDKISARRNMRLAGV